MGRLSWDEKDWPIITVQFPDGTLNRPVMEEYQAYILQLFERKTPFVVVGFHEATGSAMDSETQVFAAAFNKKHNAEFRAYFKGLAIVCSSMIARTAILIINWIAPFPYPNKAFKTRAEAFTWARNRLAP